MIGRELKLVYSTRATSRCQKQQEVRFSLTLVPLNLMAVWFSPNHGTKFSDIGTVFRTVQDRVLKVGIRADFGSGTVGKCMLDFVVNCFSG